MKTALSIKKKFDKSNDFVPPKSLPEYTIGRSGNNQFYIYNNRLPPSKKRYLSTTGKLINSGYVDRTWKGWHTTEENAINVLKKKKVTYETWSENE